jgi:thiol-disulfide isomerase/thioredoxin
MSSSTSRKQANPPVSQARSQGQTSQSSTNSLSKRPQTESRLRGTAPRQTQRAGRRRGVSVWRAYRWWLVGLTLVVIGAIVGLFLLLGHQSTANSTSSRSATDPQVLNDLALISDSQFSKVGTGNLSSPLRVIADRPMLRGPTGKPEFFYWGAEFCPYCAAERWPVVVALSRFGTFSKLPETTSSDTDAYPNTATFTFHGSVYQSNYLDFAPVELEDREGHPLEGPTVEEQQIIGSLNPDGSIPFLDIANLYLVRGQSFDPGILTGLSQRDIALQLTDPGTPVAKNILGVANYLTAAICVATADQPVSVCNTSYIQFIQRQLPRSPYAPTPTPTPSASLPSALPTTALGLIMLLPAVRRPQGEVRRRTSQHQAQKKR